MNKNQALVISDSQIIFYYTSFSVDDGVLVITDEAQFLLTDMRYYEMALKRARATVLLLDEVPLTDFLKSKEIEEVGIIYKLETALTFNELVKNFKVFDCYDIVFNKMAVKNSQEIALISKSCEIIQNSYKIALNNLKEGITEREFSAILEYNFKLQGADGASFETIVAFGEGSAIPHYKTGDVKLKKDMPVLVDFGCVYKGFCSDMTRSFYFGTPTDEYVHVYSAVLRAQEYALKNVRSGLTSVEADEVARSILKEYGLDKYFTHGLGHGIGVKVHEGIPLSKKGNHLLEDGNVFSIEPGVYINGKFGVRIEDTVYLSKGKCVPLITLEKPMAIKPL